MSLYDDEELDVGSSGWTPGGMKLLQTHVQLKKANKGNKTKHQPRVAPVVDLKSAREFGFAFPKAAGLSFLKNTREPKGGTTAYAPASLIYSDLAVPIVDEYDPLRPNDYDKAVKELRTREEEKRIEDDRHREKDRGDRDRRRSEKDRERDRDKDKDRDRERDRGRHEKDRERDRERERDRDKDKDRRRTREDSPSNGLRSNNTEGFCRVRGESDDEDEEPRGGSSRDRARKDRAGAMIAPPPSLQEKEAAGGGGGGASSSGGGSGLAFAAKIMAKYGYREGQGLGKHEHGISTALQVEKTSRRGGRIIGEKAIMPPPSIPLSGGGFGGTPAGPSSAMDESVPLMPPPPPPGSMPPPPPPGLPGLGAVPDDKREDESNITEIMKHPAKVVLLRNMVGPGEVDGDLEPEVKEECAGKYGEVLKVIIFEMPERPADEAVRIFVEFRRMEAAIKAVVDLNGRFFGGRQVKAGFYDQHKFNNLQLAD